MKRFTKKISEKDLKDKFNNLLKEINEEYSSDSARYDNYEEIEEIISTLTSKTSEYDEVIFKVEPSQMTVIGYMAGEEHLREYVKITF